MHTHNHKEKFYFLYNILFNMNKKIIKGKWWDIEKKVNKKINSKYDRIKDFKMDPKGYFLIRLDQKNNQIIVGHCVINNAKHELTTEITGKKAIEILNTIIQNNLISTLQHSGDMGIELSKAEIALEQNIKYVQDKDLIF